MLAVLSVPSILHNVIVELIEAHPEVLEYLLTLHGTPPSGPLVPSPDTFTRTVTVERRVDRVFVVGPRKSPTSFLLAEVQLDRDDDKRFGWALYLELSRTRYRCEGGLLVLTVSEGVRRWIRETIVPPTGAHGTSRQLKPTVIALDKIAPELLLRHDMPSLASLAVAAHTTSPDAAAIAEQAVDITMEHLPAHLAAAQVDAILGMVDRALRARLERQVMQHHEYRSELFRGIYNQGKAEGEAEGKAKGKAEGEAEGEAKGEAKGKAESILAVLSARGIPVSKAIRAQIRACMDLATLDLWLRRAAVAKAAATVVATGELPRARSSASSRAMAGNRSRTPASSRSRAANRSTTKRSAAKRSAATQPARRPRTPKK